MKNILKLACLVIFAISASLYTMETANKVDHSLCVVLCETDIVAAMCEARSTERFSEVATEISDTYKVEKDEIEKSITNFTRMDTGLEGKYFGLQLLSFLNQMKEAERIDAVKQQRQEDEVKLVAATLVLSAAYNQKKDETTLLRKWLNAKYPDDAVHDMDTQTKLLAFGTSGVFKGVSNGCVLQ